MRGTSDRADDAQTTQIVRDALISIGAHRDVPVTVASVIVDDPNVTVDITLHYLRATPVCCGEPGCYVPFLGRRRHDVPSAMGAALRLGEIPNVTLRVHLDYEPGYVHRELGVGRTQTLVYEPAEFRLSAS